MDRRQAELIFFLIVLLGTLVLAFFIVRPVIVLLALSAVLAVVFHGVFEHILVQAKNRSLAALLTTILAFFVVIVPLASFGYQIVVEAANLYTTLSERSNVTDLQQLLSAIQGGVQNIIPGFTIDTTDVAARVQDVLGWLVAHFGAIFAGFTKVVGGFFLLLLFFFYMVRDGNILREKFIELSPLSSIREEKILTRLASAINSIIRGTVIIAIVQGLMTGIGFTLFGVPNPALWGGVAFVAAFIPSIGTALVIIPAILFLFVTGHNGSGLGLLIWGSIAVGLIDNFLGPILVGHQAKIHPLLILVSVLGGIGVFGPFGILLGPIVMSLLLALFDIYLEMIRPPELS